MIYRYTPGCWGIWHTPSQDWCRDSSGGPGWHRSQEAADYFRVRFHRGPDYESKPLPETISCEPIT